MCRSEIRIAGAGGQGVVTAGRILAEAALLSGSYATHTQVFGPESRGGASRSDVVIASAEIDYPLANDINLLVALSSDAYGRYVPKLSEDGRLLADTRCCPAHPSRNVSQFAVVDTARAVSGGQLVTGVVALGVLQAWAGLVDVEALRRAVAARVPVRHREMNLEALQAGIDLVEGA